MQNDHIRFEDTGRQTLATELGLCARHTDAGIARIVALLAQRAEVPMAALWVVDRDRSFLTATHGLAPRELPRRSALLEQALVHDEVFVVSDASRDPRYASESLVSEDPKVHHFAAASVRVRDRQCLGLLCLMDTQAHALGEPARRALAELLPILEDHLRLRADVLHDPQTGVLTRRQFDDIADREWRRAMRGLAPISVIVLELDCLDDFSAREGAIALDRGLRAVGLAMQYSLHRPSDYVGRLDASRFVVLLPGTDEHGAQETAERLRAAVESLAIPFPDAPAGMLTLSVGVETVHSESLSRRDLAQSVHHATVALRDAQQAGGNRALLAGASGKSADV